MGLSGFIARKPRLKGGFIAFSTSGWKALNGLNAGCGCKNCVFRRLDPGWMEPRRRAQFTPMGRKSDQAGVEPHFQHAKSVAQPLRYRAISTTFCSVRPSQLKKLLETRIEPVLSAWRRGVLPLDHSADKSRRFAFLDLPPRAHSIFRTSKLKVHGIMPNPKKCPGASFHFLNVDAEKSCCFGNLIQLNFVSVIDGCQDLKRIGARPLVFHGC